MGHAIDTIGLYVTNAGATGKAPTVSAGDSLTVRYFPNTSTAKLLQFFRQDTTEGFVQITSNRLVNVTTGITARTGLTVARKMLPPYMLQTMYASDVLTAKVSGKTAATTAGHTAAGIQINYSTLPGTSQRLASWSAISGNVAYVFTQTVSSTVGAIGTWKDTLANTTTDLMEANTTYALLGYGVDVDCCMVGIRASETSTLRICGPGTTDTEVTRTYYVDASTDYGVPMIPVVNANNRGNINVTALAHSATLAIKVNLIWAQLATPVNV